MKVHKHIVIKCLIEPSFSLFKEAEWTIYLEQLIYGPLDMETFHGPVIKYCDVKGNEGFSGFALLTTSHIAFHHWPKDNVLQLDIFSCKDFDVLEVVNMIKYDLGAYNITYKELDRTGPEILVLG